MYKLHATLGIFLTGMFFSLPPEQNLKKYFHLGFGFSYQYQCFRAAELKEPDTFLFVPQTSAM